jgi:hypothetical protein
VRVPAESQLGKSGVLQASAPEVGFLDCAKDVKTEDKTCVPLGCDENVRVADERSPLNPTSGVQRKLYAPGIGNGTGQTFPPTSWANQSSVCSTISRLLVTVSRTTAHRTPITVVVS